MRNVLFIEPPTPFLGKIGRFVSEEMLIELVRCKSMLILLYGLECFLLPKSDVNSLDFAVRRLLMKLFKTVNNDVIQEFVSS